jgi:cyclopropane fatty-acyl-phospholipid synthase-like methyltransferase
MLYIQLFTIIVWIVSIHLYIKYKKILYLLIPYIIFIINEIFYYNYSLDLYNSQNRTSIFYDLSTIPTHIFKITDVNYSEGYYYDDNYNITPRESENNKYERILNLLNAKSGDVILDLGCGNGSLGKYAKCLGINVIGLTLSNKQAEECKKNGLNTIVWDYTVYNRELYNKFDHVILLGSTEHIYSGSPFLDKTYIIKKNKFTNLFIMLKKYIKNPEGKIFYSGLHINNKYKNSLGHWILDRTFGGTLQLDTVECDIFSSAKEACIKLLHKEDVTKHYYMATVLDDKHFGTPIIYTSKISIGLFILGFIYPFAWYMLIYGIYGYWMWMFDGNIHTYNKKNYSLKNRDDRPVTCWWGVFQL